MATVDFWPLTLPQPLRDYGGCSISLPNHSTRFLPGLSKSAGSQDRPEQKPAIENAVTPEDFSRPIIQLIDEVYGGRPTRLVGWSTGGFAVLHAAATHPEKVESVVSICGFARGAWNGGLGFLQAMAQRPWSRSVLIQALRLGLLRPQVFDTFMMRMCASRKGPDVRRRAEACELSRGMSTHNLKALAEAIGQIRSFDITPSFSSIRCPVRIMAGDKDPVVPYEEALHLAKNLPQSELQTLNSCGHLYFAEAPDAANEHLIRWLPVD